MASGRGGSSGCFTGGFTGGYSGGFSGGCGHGSHSCSSCSFSSHRSNTLHVFGSKAAAAVTARAGAREGARARRLGLWRRPSPSSLLCGLALRAKGSLATVVTRERRGRGYDLVRVGNLSEQPGAVADIAFFHQRATLAQARATTRPAPRRQPGLVRAVSPPARRRQVYDEKKFGRQRLARQCCGALRDVCSVFDYDAARVTLFFEPGALSRFVRQKLLFNIAPVEEQQKARRLADVRTDAFVYAYFYGLMVHKLAHFFDVVHGTRHDFFMSEYRAHYALRWVELLLARGFEPADVERRYASECWEVVN